MKSKFQSWLRDIKSVKKGILIALAILVVTSVLYQLSGNYVDKLSETAASPDLILDTIGPYDFGLLYVWLFLLVNLLFVVYPLIYKPKELPYVIVMYSLFVLVRSGFIIMTHLRMPHDAIVTNFPSYISLLSFSNDLFFSGHTGLPFMGFLIFRKSNKVLAYFMLASSVILGITVLVMHLHYTIDVLSAYFITYGVYVIGNKFFSK